ncbi:MAG: PAS domain S-box protein [Chlorobiales bacterium]|jgi:PAS domain S-box-containing protein|nr:PAS domain S-box protein [Chlorobiales bacterium]
MDHVKQGFRKSEYAIIVEQAPIMIWRANTTAECDYFNQRWTEFTGRALEQEVGNGWAEGVHPDDFQRCLDFYLINFKQEKVFEMEYRLRRHDGVYRWLFDRGVPFYDDDGTFMGYIGSCIDVTERIEAEEALLKAKESEVKELQGLLPICMHCKKIRNDTGYWEKLEAYISERTRAKFSHAVCEECIEKYYPKLRSNQ